MKFETIPVWCIGETKDAGNLITALCLAGFEGKWIRLSAEQQRQIIGCSIIGKQLVRVSASTVETFRKVCFGQDFDHQVWTAAEFDKRIKQNLKCSDVRCAL